MLAFPRYLAVVMAVLLALVGLSPARATAQTCHHGAPRSTEQDQHPFSSAVGLLAAAYGGNEPERGTYQGLYAVLGFHQPWWALELSLPAYRLHDRDGTRLGLGDLTVGASATFLRAFYERLRVGAALPVMLPTGSQAKSLGMGHVMPMPNLWLQLELTPFALHAEVGYARAIGAERHAGHEAHGPSEAHPLRQAPLVNPMNESEVEHALTLELGLQRHLRARARWFGAIPVELEGGRGRQIVGGGATLSFRPLEFTAEVQVPVYGDPFDVKLLFQLAALY